MPPASMTERAVTRRYVFSTSTTCSGASRSARAVEPRRSAKRIVTVCLSPARRSGSPWMTRSTTVGGRNRSRPRRRSSSMKSAPIAMIVAIAMRTWYSHHEGVHVGPRNCEPGAGRCVADREEERRRPDREHRGDPDDERGASFLRVALQHARRREAMHREDPGHAREAHRDEQRRVMTDLEGGTRYENGDRKRDERDVRRDDEVLDRDDPRRVRGRRRQEPREDGER